MEGNPVNDFKRWFRQFPAFSRWYIAFAFVITVTVSLHLLSAYDYYYSLPLTFKSLHIWRPFTSFAFFGKFSFGILFSLFFAYFAVSKVETELFSDATYGDFVWLVSYLWLSLITVATLFETPFLTDSFTFAMLYIWCKRRPFEIIRFLFGFEIKSGYFPFVLMGINVLMGASLLNYVFGLAFGHLYIFVKDVMRVKYNKDYLATPRFITQAVQKYITGPPRGPNRREAEPERPRFFGGQGVRLG